MAKQNRYQISRSDNECPEWNISSDVWSGDTWQDAIQQWLKNDRIKATTYQVASETPSEDGRSGITEIQFYPADFFVDVRWYLKATLIAD